MSATNKRFSRYPRGLKEQFPASFHQQLFKAPDGEIPRTSLSESPTFVRGGAHHEN